MLKMTLLVKKIQKKITLFNMCIRRWISLIVWLTNMNGFAYLVRKYFQTTEFVKFQDLLWNLDIDLLMHHLGIHYWYVLVWIAIVFAIGREGLDISYYLIMKSAELFFCTWNRMRCSGVRFDANWTSEDQCFIATVSGILLLLLWTMVECRIVQ